MRPVEPATPVLVSNPELGLRNQAGILASISPLGFYEIELDFGERGVYKALLPIAGTVLLARDQVPRLQSIPNIER